MTDDAIITINVMTSGSAIELTSVDLVIMNKPMMAVATDAIDNQNAILDFLMIDSKTAEIISISKITSIKIGVRSVMADDELWNVVASRPKGLLFIYVPSLFSSISEMLGIHLYQPGSAAGSYRRC